jgi:hypothetical protein
MLHLALQAHRDSMPTVRTPLLDSSIRAVQQR